MTTPENDRLAKIEHPETVYANPDDVLKDDSLSADEKKQALENWKRDAVEELTAADEGMPASDSEIDSIDEEIEKVAEAERQLDSGSSDG